MPLPMMMPTMMAEPPQNPIRRGRSADIRPIQTESLRNTKSLSRDFPSSEPRSASDGIRSYLHGTVGFRPEEGTHPGSRGRRPGGDRGLHRPEDGEPVQGRAAAAG